MRSNVSVGLVGKALEFVTLVLLFTLVPRLLGPADYGSFAVALSIVALGSAASSLGGPTWLSRFVPTVAEGDRPALARTLALRAARWRIGICALAAALALGLAVVRTQAGSARSRASSSFSRWCSTSLRRSCTRLASRSARWPSGALDTRSRTPFSWRPTRVHVGFVERRSTRRPRALVRLRARVGLVVVAAPLRAAERTVPLPLGAARFALVYGASGLFVQLLHRGGVVAVAVAGRLAGGGGIRGGLDRDRARADLCRLAGVHGRSAAARRGGDEAGDRADASLRRLAWLALAVVVPVATLAAISLDRIVPAVAGEGYRGVESLGRRSVGPAIDALERGIQLALRAADRLPGTGSRLSSPRADARTATLAAGGATAFLLGTAEIARGAAGERWSSRRLRSRPCSECRRGRDPEVTADRD